MSSLKRTYFAHRKLKWTLPNHYDTRRSKISSKIGIYSYGFMQSITQNSLCLLQHSNYRHSPSHRGSFLCLKNTNFEIKGSVSCLHGCAKRPYSRCRGHCTDLLVLSMEAWDLHSVWPVLWVEQSPVILSWQCAVELTPGLWTFWWNISASFSWEYHVDFFTFLILSHALVIILLNFCFSVSGYVIFSFV